MEFKANDYHSNEILKFIRQCTGLTQKEFAESIKKSKNWVKSNEQGVTRYFFDDLLIICKKYDIDIIIKEKN